MPALSSITAMILAGGLGTRLRPLVSDRPKVVAEVQRRPFLTLLLEQLAGAGMREVVLCTGFQADLIEKELGDRYKSLELIYSREAEPLGTGGALRLALEHCPSDPILAMNGDSFINADLAAYYSWFWENDLEASLLLVGMADTHRFGKVKVREDGLVLGFEEKEGSSGPGWINAGVYIFKRHVLLPIPLGRPFSLERDLFPRLADRNIYGYQVEGDFIDIGTPESYVEADKFFQKFDISPTEQRWKKERESH